MGGPAAEILLPHPLGQAGEAACREELRVRADEMSGDDLWISGRPFGVGFGEEVPGNLEELAAEGLGDVLGWLPRDAICLHASCNGAEDHRTLGKLCLRFAIQFDGIVDFCGRILGGRAPRATPGQARRIDNPSGLVGTLYETWYRVGDGTYVTKEYGDARLMESWLCAPGFRMVK
jgi:hypothetical protein